MTTAVGGYNKSTLSVWNRQTGTQFSVNTGADVCVFPASALVRQASSPTGSLMAANGSKNDTWGCRTLTLNFGDKRTYRQDFYLTDVTRSILGANFFTVNNVAIDLRSRRLIDLNSCCTLSAELEMQFVTLSGLTFNTATEYYFPSLIS